MLGHSGVGKTTYMASMYGTLQTPINGFSLRAQNDTHHNELLREFINIRNGNYPAATVQRAQYNFSLHFEGNAVFPFQWIDYRGGALQERRENSEQASQLISELKGADGILLFCSADPRDSKKVKSQIARMTTLVTQGLKNSTTPTTIAVVFTKSDLVKKIDSSLTDLVDNLFEAIHASKMHAGTLLPIACGPTLVNTEAPVLFSLHFGILFQTMRLLVEERHWEEVRKQHIAKSETLLGIFGDVVNTIRGESTNADYARAALRRVEEKQREMSKLEQPAHLLGVYLEDWPIIVGELLRG